MGRFSEESSLLVKVSIVILNYNNWEDTLDCVESLLRLDYGSFSIIVCDNASSDQSLDQIKSWARKKCDNFSSIHQTKKTERLSAETTSKYLLPRSIPSENLFPEYLRFIPLTILENVENFGFAGGVNEGIRVALDDSELSYVWILNNDTIVDNKALKHLVIKGESERDIGLCGSTLLYWHEKSLVQALGGFEYNKYLGASRQLGHLSHWDSERTSSNFEQDIERIMDGVQGASVFVRRSFLETIGLMSEEYFLFFEEQDWAVRGQKKFSLGYASQSIVYHKEGRTTHANTYSQNEKDYFIEFCLIRSRFMFTKKFYAHLFPIVYLSQIALVFKRLLQGNILNSLFIACTILFFGLFYLRRSQKRNALIEYHELIKRMDRYLLGIKFQ